MDMLCQLSYKGVLERRTLAPAAGACQADKPIPIGEARDLLTLFPSRKTPYKRRSYLVAREGQQSYPYCREEQGLEEDGDPMR
jgi:hypothetical protein